MPSASTTASAGGASYGKPGTSSSRLFPGLPLHRAVDCWFAHRVDALCPAHRAIELLGVAGAFLVLEECVVGAVVDLVIFLFWNGMIHSLFAFSWDYHRIFQNSRITSVILIDLCALDSWTRSNMTADCIFLCMRYIYPKFQIDGWYFKAMSWIYYYMNKQLMHVCGILFGLNRIVSVTMYISIVCFLDFISILIVWSISQKVLLCYIGFSNFIYLVIWSLVLVALLAL
jgi:hypothetical protein